jgi:hypothetical protein
MVEPMGQIYQRSLEAVPAGGITARNFVSSRSRDAMRRRI